MHLLIYNLIDCLNASTCKYLDLTWYQFFIHLYILYSKTLKLKEGVGEAIEGVGQVCCTVRSEHCDKEMSIPVLRSE